MGKRTYGVSIPMAGHLYVEVEADNEEEAIKAAFDKATIDDLEGWEPLEQFNQGNVCYCPSPWEVEAEDFGEVENAA